MKPLHKSIFLIYATQSYDCLICHFTFLLFSGFVLHITSKFPTYFIKLIWEGFDTEEAFFTRFPSCHKYFTHGIFHTIAFIRGSKMMAVTLGLSIYSSNVLYFKKMIPLKELNSLHKSVFLISDTESYEHLLHQFTFLVFPEFIFVLQPIFPPFP